jgi:hypothetical protein
MRSDLPSKALALAALAGLWAAAANGQDTPSADTADTPIEFQLAVDLLPPAGIMLSNGVVVRPSDWQAVILANIPATAMEGARSCTGSLVGSKVVLLAAHCVDRILGGPPRKARLTVDDAVADLVCTLHDGYARLPPRLMDARGSEDYALCLLKFPGQTPQRLKEIRTEVLDAHTALPASTRVLLSGYGCSELRIVDDALDYDRSDKQLRIGEGTIDIAAGAVPSLPTYLTIRSPAAALPAICPGDSGGPLFTGATVVMPDVPRRIVGVNSAVRLERGADGSHQVISRIAATGNASFRTWAEGWIRDNGNPAVCGINRAANTPPCRP